MATLSDDLLPPRGSMREAVRIQGRVIKALILRELHTRYGKENIGYLWLIIEPMLLAMVVGLIHAHGTNLHRGDIKAVPMALLGYCNFMVFRSIFNRGEGALESSLPLMYHRTVKPFDILLARAILEALGCWLAFATLMGAAVFVGMANPPARLDWLLIGMIFMWLVSFTASLLVAGLTYERKMLGRLVHPISYVMMPLSGCFFLVAQLPGPLRDAFLWSPLVHINEMLRYGWFHAANDKFFDVAYVIKWVMGLLLFGLLLLAQARKRIHMP